MPSIYVRDMLMQNPTDMKGVSVVKVEIKSTKPCRTLAKISLTLRSDGEEYEHTLVVPITMRTDGNSMPDMLEKLALHPVPSRVAGWVHDYLTACRYDASFASSVYEIITSERPLFEGWLDRVSRRILIVSDRLRYSDGLSRKQRRDIQTIVEGFGESENWRESHDAPALPVTYHLLQVMLSETALRRHATTETQQAPLV